MPSARAFYEREFRKLSRESQGRRRTKCCFHDGDNPLSLSLHMVTGAFHCFSCGAKGGDVVAFVMLRDQCDFKTACKTLGCWDDHPRPLKQRMVREIVGRNLVCHFVIDGQHYTSIAVPDDPADWLQLLRRCFHFAEARLHEIRAGDAEDYAGETETLWGILADSFELIRSEEQKAVAHE